MLLGLHANSFGHCLSPLGFLSHESAGCVASRAYCSSDALKIHGTFSKLMYDLAMRRYFLLALILLTSLRGFVGDAMAIDMSRMHQSTTTAVHHSVTSKASSSEHPCHLAEAVSTDVVQNASECSPSASCMSCQVCHTPALQNNIAFSVSFALPSEHGDLRAFSWMSADLVQPQKPPVL
jgi:hypothetical protein